MKNTLRTPAYIKVKHIIESCKHLPHWETARKCLENYEARWKVSEYGLRTELQSKLQKISA